ncbi:MAG: PhzF family phenazine biosynthesis protein [Polyangiales bacterium]
MRKLNYTLVDVFTERPLEGKPLAVFTLTQPLAPAHMQRIARELNLTETAFVCPTAARSTASLRAFTPSREVPFASHTLVGSAYVIGRSAPIGLLRFETGIGVVDVIIEREGGFVSRCAITQPVPTWRDAEVDPALLRDALGVEVKGPLREGDNGRRFLLVPVADVDAVKPEMGLLAKLPWPVAVYEPPRERAVRQRLFAPSEGVAEDPVTGSLTGVVGQRLLLDGLIEEGDLVVTQGAHVGRPGQVWAYITRAHAPRIGGACASVARGTVEVPLG